MLYDVFILGVPQPIRIDREDIKETIIEIIEKNADDPQDGFLSFMGADHRGYHIQARYVVGFATVKDDSDSLM